MRSDEVSVKVIENLPHGQLIRMSKETARVAQIIRVLSSLAVLPSPATPNRADSLASMPATLLPCVVERSHSDPLESCPVSVSPVW